MFKKKVIFTIIFTIIGFIALQIPFTNVVGSNTHFTLFDFIAPISGSFLGGLIGVISVLLMQIGNWLIHGANFEASALIRLFPMLFAVWYFSSSAKAKYSIFIPLVCMALFIIHPIGRQAFVYSLYWLIPPLMYFFKEKFLLAKALGATFTAHAVGGAAWIYAFNLPKEVWLGLIPQVALERGLFALGIVASYVVFSNILDWVSRISRVELSFLRLNQKLLLSHYFIKK